MRKGELPQLMIFTITFYILNFGVILKVIIGRKFYDYILGETYKKNV